MDAEILLGDIISVLSNGYGFFYVRLVDADTDEDIFGYTMRVLDVDRDVCRNYYVVGISPDEVGGCIKLSVIEVY